MRDGGRISAAIEVLTEIETRRQPVQIALKDWGQSHRFAGSGDRVAIGNLVFDALRHKLSYAHIFGEDSPRALALATYCFGWGNKRLALEKVLSEDPHAPEQLSDDETSAMDNGPSALKAAPDHVQADVPEWLWHYFTEAFGADAVKLGQSLAERAPIDIRVNLLKSEPEKLLKRLSHLGAKPSGISPVGLRLAPVTGPKKSPHVQAEEGFRKGWFELQDEASQIASILVGAKPGEQVLDLCAGGGGKSLALAGQMENRGQIYAYDANKLRLAPLYERVRRAGVRNLQVIDPQTGSLDALEGSIDRVMVDAPCSGTGVWRRRPDTKWRITENALNDRLEEQREVLEHAAKFVKVGGKLVYVTCSLLSVENQGQIANFLEQHPEFKLVDLKSAWENTFANKARTPIFGEIGYTTLSPLHTNTDGFFIAILERN